MQKAHALRMRDNTRFSTGMAEIAAVRAAQIQQGGKPCYMTAERLFCKTTDCKWCRDCRKLVAVWKR